MTLAHKSPIVKSIVFNLIREVHYEKFKAQTNDILDSSIIPQVSSKIAFQRGFKESNMVQRSLPPQKFIPLKRSTYTPNSSKEKIIQETKKESPREDLAGFKESIIGEGVLSKKSVAAPTLLQKKPLIPLKKLPQAQKTSPNVVPINLFQNPPNYGKLNMIIKDRFVSYIDCPGPDQRIVVTKNGQKQQTNISLTKEEIQMLLNNISSKTKIPLLTGVFRVSWDNFIINAVVSDVLEPRFLIKKGA